MLPNITTFPAPHFESKSQKMALVLPEIMDKNSAANTNFIFRNDPNGGAGVAIILGTVGISYFRKISGIVISALN